MQLLPVLLPPCSLTIVPRSLTEPCLRLYRENELRPWMHPHTSQGAAKGFKAFVGASRGSEVSSFANQLATRCHPDLLWPLASTSHIPSAPWVQPGLSPPVHAPERPYAGPRPAQQSVSWKGRIGPETTGLEKQDGHQLHPWNVSSGAHTTHLDAEAWCSP